MATLRSHDVWLRVIPAAEFDFGCAGNGEHQAVRQFSPSCERRIHRGAEYVEQLALLNTFRKLPRLFYVESRHCAHCALAFFPAVNVGGERAA